MTAYLLECLPYDAATGAKKLVVFANGLVDESYLGRTIPYPLRLKNSFTMETSVFENNVPSSTSFSLGSIDINNADGRFDDLLELGWGGASLVLLAGPENGSYFDFRPVFTGAVLDLSANASNLTLVLRDTSWLFAEKLQKNTYSGGGGAEGFADLAGQYKPLCYALAKNVSPVAVDTINLCYQVHDGSIVGITGVYDDAVRLTLFGNYATYADLVAAKIPTGSYATCLSAGFFRLGAPAVGVLTADVRGEYYGATSLSGVLYSILMYKVGLPAAVLDVPTFSEHATEYPYAPSGIYYQNPDVQIDEFLDALVGMCDSFWNITTSSKLAIRRFKFRPPVAGIREENIKDLQRQTNSKPVYTVTVQYDRNLTVQDSGSMPISDGDLLASLNQDIIWYPNAPVSGVLSAYIGNTKVNDLKIVTFSKPSNVSWATIDNVGRFVLTDAPDGGRVNFRVEYMAQKVDVELLVRRRADGTGFYLDAQPDIFQFRKDGTPLTPGSSVVVTAATNTGLRTNAWDVTDNFGKAVPFYNDGPDKAVVETSAISSGTSSYVIFTQLYNGDPVNRIHVPISRTDASVGELGGGGTYNDGTPIDDLKPQEAGSNITESRVSEAVRGQGEWATLTTLPPTTVGTKLGKIQPDGTIKLGYEGILLSEKGDYWITDSTVVTTLGIASGIAKQGALAIQNSADWQTQVQGPGRPENYATAGVNLIYNGNAETTAPNEDLLLRASPVGWACVEGTQGNVNGMYGDEGKVRLEGIYVLESIADAPVSGKRGFRINKSDVGHGVAYGARAVPVKPGEKIVMAIDYFGATGSSGGLYFRAQFKAVKPATGFVTEQDRDVIVDFMDSEAVSVHLQHREYVVTVPPGMFWMTVSVYNWVNGPIDLRFDNVQAYRVVDFSVAVGGVTKPENNATVGAIAGVNLLDGINGIVLALNSIKTSLGIASGFLNQGALAIKSTVTTSLMTEASDNLVPDGSFTDVVWWKGGMPDMNPGANFSVGSAQNNEFWGLSTGWLIMSPGDFDPTTPYFNVSLGGTYKIEVRVYTTDDFEGWVNPILHIPYIAWFSLTRGQILDPNDPNLSDLRSGGISIRKEWIFKNPPSSGENWWRRWQFRMRGVITRGNCHFQVRITRMAALNSLVTRNDGTTLLTDAAAVTDQGTAAGFAGQAAWATFTGLIPSNVAGQVSKLQTDGNAPASMVYDPFGLGFLSDVFPAERGANATEGRTAAAFVGQGALAKKNSVDYASEITGSGRPETFIVGSLGNGSSGPDGYLHGLHYGDGRTVTPASNVYGRSYGVFVYNLNSRAWEGKFFDVYGNGEIQWNLGGPGANDANGMAVYLNSLPRGWPVVVYTSDEPSNNHLNAALVAAMCRCGATRTVFGSGFRIHSAYILVGETYAGEGNGSEAYYDGGRDTSGVSCVSKTFSLVNGRVAVSNKALGSADDLKYLDGTTVQTLRPGEGGANVTEGRTAAGFAGQGALAKQNSVDYASQLTSIPSRLGGSPVHGPAYLDAAVVAFREGETTQSLRPQEGGANATEGRTAAGFAGQGALAKQNSVDYGSQVSSIPARLGPNPWHGAGYLDARAIAFSDAVGYTVQDLKPGEGGANVTEGRTAAGFAGQGALAKVSYIQQTNVASYFNFNAFSLNYSITRQDGTSIVTENLAITSLGVSSGFQGQGTLAKLDQVGTSQIAPSSVQAIRFTRLSSTISLSQSQYRRIMEIGITKAESGSLLKVSAFLALYAVDDIRCSVFVNVYDASGNLAASRTSTSNMVFDNSQSRARMPLSPICHFAGLGPGYYTVTIDAQNTDPRLLDFEVDSSLEVMELKQAAM